MKKSVDNMSPGFEPTPQWIYKFVIVDFVSFAGHWLNQYRPEENPHKVSHTVVYPWQG